MPRRRHDNETERVMESVNWFPPLTDSRSRDEWTGSLHQKKALTGRLMADDNAVIIVFVIVTYRSEGCPRRCNRLDDVESEH